MVKSKLREILFKNKLNGRNYDIWYLCMRNVLIEENLMYVLENPFVPDPSDFESIDGQRTHDQHSEDSSKVTFLLFKTIEPFAIDEDSYCEAYGFMDYLRKRFWKGPKAERCEITKCLCSTRYVEGEDLDLHLTFMEKLIERKNELGSAICSENAIDMILHSLPNSFKEFKRNFRAYRKDGTIDDLHRFAVIYGDSLKGKARARRNDGKGKSKDLEESRIERFNPQPSVQGKRKKGAQPDEACFHCGNPGHWKRNCPKYLQEVRESRSSMTISSSVADNLDCDYDNFLLDDETCDVGINLDGVGEVSLDDIGDFTDDDIPSMFDKEEWEREDNFVIP